MPDAPRLRGAERDELIRSQIVPLPPGERPRAILVCVAVCAVVALGNLVLWAAGWEVRRQQATAASAIVPALLFTAVGVGLWRTRLLAVAAMQMLLAVTALFAAGGLLVASNLWSVVLGLAIMVLSTALFWPLIRINARIGARDRVEDHG